MNQKTLIVIVGPTAVGKTSVSIELAKKLNCEIMSCDSRQFFKEMSIGTAKPTVEEMDGVPHHFIDSHSIHTPYSVGDFEREGLEKLNQLFQKNDTAIMVGGSGLYVKAICEGFDDFPDIDSSIREGLITKAETEGIEPLQKQLQELDPIHYEKMDTHNTQRLIRALEVCIGTGKPYSSFTTNKTNKRPFNILKIGITLDRESLYKRINLRVDVMMKAGLLDEAKALYEYKNNNALQTVGYKELFDFFEKKTSLEQAIELIKQNSRRYAKRQMTWFKRDEEIHWFQPIELPLILEVIKKSGITT